MFLGFHWDRNGEVNYCFHTSFIWAVYGLLSLSKLTRPLIQYWHGRGLKAIIYLDDGIFAVRGENEAKLESMQARQDLKKQASLST